MRSFSVLLMVGAACSQPLAAAPLSPPATPPTAPPTTTPTAPPPATTPPAPSVPALRTFTFAAQATKLLPGDSTAADGTCTAHVDAADQLGSIAVLSTFAQNDCYTDGQYNARGFVVEQGTVTSSDGAAFDAYRLHPPRAAATKFLASHHFAYYRFAKAEDHTIYTLEADSVAVVAKITAREIMENGPSRLPIDVSTLGSTTTYFVVPSSQMVTSLTKLGPKVYGAELPATPLGTLAMYRHTTGGVPFDTRMAPGGGLDVRMDRRRLFPLAVGGGMGVVWQDTIDQRVRITVLSRDQLTEREVTIDNPRADVLAAVASDGATSVFLFFVQKPGKGELTTRAARMFRIDLATDKRVELAADASAAGLDITNFDDVASMRYDQGRLVLMLARTMHRSPDGLNHQGGIAVEFDATTLAVTQNHGQTSGHSFDNVLVSAGPGELVGIDLGDNYPRGVHFHRFARKGGKPTWDAALAYTFKTLHGTTPQAPDGRVHPAYPEISGATPFYKWSNDNGTYTELGGVVATPTGYTVVFAGEATGGKALDNARAREDLGDPRNLGVVHIRRDFETVPPFGSVIPDKLMLTKGAPETGGFYAFGGTWTPQRNTGVVWLTHHRTVADNASRIRVAGLADGNLLVLWEQWNRTAYVSTFGMKIDPLGKVLTPAVDLGSRVRLGRRDDLWVDGNDVYIVNGRASDRALDVLVLHAR